MKWSGQVISTLAVSANESLPPAIAIILRMASASLERSQPDAHQRHWIPYLHFGYLPGTPPTSVFSWTERDAGNTEVPERFEEAVEVAGELLGRVIADSLTSGSRFVVPLSGGLDSRALLLGAMDAGADVSAATFGVPGALDFEIGRELAIKLDVEHTALDLRELLPRSTDLVDAVKAGGAWTHVFDAYFNQLLSNKLESGVTVISGFMGDPIAGSKLRQEAGSGLAALAEFVEHERFGRGLDLLPRGYNLVRELTVPAQAMLGCGFTDYECLDFAMRQMGAIKPIVVDGHESVVTPFLDARWIAFMSGVRPEWRRSGRLYEAVLLRRWGRAFRHRTKTLLGLGVHARPWRRCLRRRLFGVGRRLGGVLGFDAVARQMTNYVDLDLGFRKDALLRELARRQLCELRERGVVDWIDPTEVLEKHISGGADLSREIELLIGLEINLKVELCT